MENSRRKKEFDWNEFWEDFPWFWVIIGILVIFGAIEEIVRAKNPGPVIPKEQAVIIEMHTERNEKDKIKFLDGVIAMEYLDDGFAEGDTILVER